MYIYVAKKDIYVAKLKQHYALKKQHNRIYSIAKLVQLDSPIWVKKATFCVKKATYYVVVKKATCCNKIATFCVKKATQKCSPGENELKRNA